MPSRAMCGSREHRCGVGYGREIACPHSELRSTTLNADLRPAPSAAFKFSGRLAIVGGFDGTHVGGSLWRAAAHLGIETAKFDVSAAAGKSRILRAALWRLGDRR